MGARGVLLIAMACTVALEGQGTAGWQLVWSDEFTGLANTPPDPAKWSYDLGNGVNGWGNYELENYASSTDNVFLDGSGNLVIRALNTSGGYTSGRIKTAGKFSFQYGKIEVRAKIPYAQGIWPAIWMLGASFPQVPWPDCGEIDLMENFGVLKNDVSTIHSAVHGMGDNGVGIGSSYSLPSGQKFADDFHVFAAEWSPDGLTFSVDGNPYLGVSSSSLTPSWQSALANPFFLLLDVAVGGTPVGAPDSATTFPQQMLVDYVRVYQSLSAGSLFVPVTPCRIADTRNAAGPFGGPSITGQTSRDFLISNSACGIPANATAYSLNVAVVPQGPLSYLTVWPLGQPQPFVATLNSDGRIKSNAAIVPAGNGGISVFATNTTDLVLDINGYFVPSSAQTGLAFYPLAPCRIADTRNTASPLGGPKLAAQTSRTFPIASACNVPPTAQAYSLNFAAVPTGPLGFLTAWPTGQPQPLVASLNAVTGSITANAVVVQAGSGGNVDVYTTDDTDLVIDINGYFAPPGPGGLSFYADVPCRLADSRFPLGTPPLAGVLNVPVVGRSCAASASAEAYVLNTTVVPPGPLGYITMWAQGQPQPLAATLNATDAAITSNLAIAPTMNGYISIYPSAPTYLVLDMFGFFAP